MRQSLGTRAWILAVIVVGQMVWGPTGKTARGQAWRPAPTDAVAPPEPMREYRAAWVAVVANIDWPSKRDLSTAQQRAEMRAMVESAAALHLNALFVQVRPACDAIYPSTIEPWSEFLTGESGRGPQPMYDPLAEWITLCHEKGIELHAWFNPFRARHFESKLPDAPSHISNTRPDLVRTYTNLKWLDPGEREAQDHSLRVMLDVVHRYDLDGVHIDDYFYPYPDAKVAFPDEASWAKYVSTGGTLARDDWRRFNINSFVRRMHDEIGKTKPAVKVGVSPFGIWKPGFPAGVEGMDATQKLYADAKLWLNEGWLDYCVPQLYWKLDSAKQPYGKLLEWWAGENKKERMVLAGNYASRVPGAKASEKKASDASWPASEIVAQVNATRECAGASGNAMFSMIALKENRGGLAEALKTGLYREGAIVPRMAWKREHAPYLAKASVTRVGAVGAAGTLDVAWVEERFPDAGAPRWWLVATRRGEAWEVRTLFHEARRASVGAEGVDAVAIAGMTASGEVGNWLIFVPSVARAK